MKMPERLQFLADFSTLLVNGAAIMGTCFAAVAGTSATLSKASAFPTISLSDATFPIRLVAFIVIASALGWGLGALVQRCSQSRKEGIRLLCPLAGLCWGGLLIGTGQWATANGTSGYPELTFFTFVGLGLALRLCSFQFRSLSGPIPLGVVRTRCDALLAFALSAGALLILTTATGA